MTSRPLKVPQANWVDARAYQIGAVSPHIFVPAACATGTSPTVRPDRDVIEGRGCRGSPIAQFGARGRDLMRGTHLGRHRAHAPFFASAGPTLRPSADRL